MSRRDFWAPFLSELEEGIQKTSSDVKFITFGIAGVLDQLRSGESIDGVLPDLVRLFSECLRVPRWHIRQNAGYGWIHIFKLAPADALLESIGSIDDLNSPLALLVSLLGDCKREVRDSAAQALGALSGCLAKTSDPALVLRLLLEITGPEARQAPPPSMPGDHPWEIKEGHTMALGWAGKAASASVGEARFRELILRLIAHGSDESVPGYSNYVRFQSFRALQRVLVNPAFAAMLPSVLADLEQAIAGRLGDDNIDVRKAVAGLFALWAQHGDARANVESLLPRTRSDRWQARHGSALALNAATQSLSLMAGLGVSAVSQVISTLTAQATAPIQGATTREAQVSGAANAAAGIALASLFVWLATEAPDATCSVMSEGAGLEGVWGAHVRPVLLHFLQSPDAALLDAGCVCIARLGARLPAFMRPRLDELCAAAYPNRFHAAYPIRDAALRLSAQACALMETAETALTARLTPQLVTHLTQASKQTNCDAREMAFHATRAVLQQEAAPEHLFDAATVEGMQAMLLAGMGNASGGVNAEYPRAAAVGAYTAFLRLTARRPGLLPAAHLQAGHAALAAALRETDTIVIAAIAALRTLYSTAAPADIPPASSVGAALLALAHHPLDKIALPATAACLDILGPLGPALADDSELLGAVLDALEGDSLCAVDAEQNDELNNRIAAARLCARLAQTDALKTHPDAAARLARLAATSLTDVDNLDVPPLEGAALAALVASLGACTSDASEVGDALQHAGGFALHLLRGAAVDEFDPDECDTECTELADEVAGLDEEAAGQHAGRVHAAIRILAAAGPALEPLRQTATALLRAIAAVRPEEAHLCQHGLVALGVTENPLPASLPTIPALPEAEELAGLESDEAVALLPSVLAHPGFLDADAVLLLCGRLEQLVHAEEPDADEEWLAWALATAPLTAACQGFCGSGPAAAAASLAALAAQPLVVSRMVYARDALARLSFARLLKGGQNPFQEFLARCHAMLESGAAAAQPLKFLGTALVLRQMCGALCTACPRFRQAALSVEKTALDALTPLAVRALHDTAADTAVLAGASLLFSAAAVLYTVTGAARSDEVLAALAPLAEQRVLAKPFRAIGGGVTGVHAAVGLALLVDTDSPNKDRVLQGVADVLFDEDVALSNKQHLASVLLTAPRLGPHLRRVYGRSSLPAPTPVDVGKINDTFSKFM